MIVHARFRPPASVWKFVPAVVAFCFATEQCSPQASDTSSALSSQRPQQSSAAADISTAAVTTVDLDIDSDNNDGFNYPQNTAWEELLEDHAYAIGKLIKTGATHFTPVRIRLPKGLNADSRHITVRIDFSVDSRSGVVRVWNTYRADPDRLNEPTCVRQGGDRLYPHTDYSLSDLNYDPATGGAVFWIQAHYVWFRHLHKDNVDRNGKPDDRLRVAVQFDGRQTADDEVRYIVTQNDSFYDKLQNHQQIRTVLAAEHVCVSGECPDLPQYALKKLNAAELRTLNIDVGILSNTSKRPSASGLNMILYRDYVSGAYILAVGMSGKAEPQVRVGTEPQLNPQHFDTVKTTLSVLQRCDDVHGKLIATGKHLAGGLVKAAAVELGIPADVYNPYGILNSTTPQRRSAANLNSDSMTHRFPSDDVAHNRNRVHTYILNR